MLSLRTRDIKKPLQTALKMLSLRGFKPAKYFRTGAYTHLQIAPLKKGSDNHTIVAYTYTYRDLGVDHVIHKTFRVKSLPHSSYFWVQGESEDWQRVRGRQRLYDALFDHYRAHRDELYAELGITQI
jgi:hypothetical protein